MASPGIIQNPQAPYFPKINLRGHLVYIFSCLITLNDLAVVP